MAVVMRGIKGSGVLDLVCAWYVKATHYTKAVNPSPGMSAIGCAFVSTNSITQGEQVGVLWGWLLGQGVKIQFAHRTFQWSNEARGMAAVHCVIVGFGRREWERRTIFECEHIQGEPHAVPAANINPYLVDGPDVALGNRRSPICRVPPISFGSMPNDGGNLLLSDDERLELIGDEPMARQWIRPFSGSVEFINNEVRWCLWLRDCSPSALRRMPRVARRIAAVKAHREKSDRPATRALAALPMIFGEDRQPIGQYLAIPKTSSERRQFIPIAVAPSTCIASTELFTIFPVESLYFGSCAQRCITLGFALLVVD